MRIWPTSDGSIALARIEDLVIVVNRPVVSDRAWEEWVENAEECFDLGPTLRLWNFSPKFAPSPTQFSGLLRHHMRILVPFQRFAIITGSAVVRSAVKLMAWMTPARMAVRSYHPERAWRALDWLLEGGGIQPAEAHELVAKLLAEAGYIIPEPSAGTQLA